MSLLVCRQKHSNNRTFEDGLQEYLEIDEAIRDLAELDLYDPFANEDEAQEGFKIREFSDLTTLTSDFNYESTGIEEEVKERFINNGFDDDFEKINENSTRPAFSSQAQRALNRTSKIAANLIINILQSARK